jgi:IS5 family transposase
MLGKLPGDQQRDLFRPHLIDFMDMNHELVQLAHAINWQRLESELSVFYSRQGQPSVPIRRIAGCLILKQLYNYGDDSLPKAWVMNPYMQYFCGESQFQHTFPFDPSDFVHFRHRIGEAGVNIIFRHSVELHGKSSQEPVVLSDTTVQGNATTYPTDSKLYFKIIDTCNRIAQREDLPIRQSYKRVSKPLVRDSYNSKHPKRKKQAEKSRRRLHTIAGRMVRELERNLLGFKRMIYQSDIDLFHRVLNQEKKDSHKVYSLHKPYTDCISKGKSHKPYEFGNKVGFLLTSNSLVITAVRTYLNNPHDSRTIEPLVEQLERNNLSLPREIVYDRAAKGIHQIKGVKVSIPGKALKTDNAYKKQKKRKKFRRRAAIEPVNAHLKSDFRMSENYLLGESYVQLNALLSATAWNLKKWMQKAISWLLEKWIDRVFTYRINFSFQVA